MLLTEIDSELEATINRATPEFAKSLKRRFTNVGISESISGREPSVPAVKFADFFIREGDNDIILRNLVIKNEPKVRLNDITPNLFERNLQLNADWYNTVIEGSYELSNSSQIRILPVKNLGNIRIVIENVSTKGVVGFKTFKDALKTTNFDLKFNAENINIEIEYYDHQTKQTTKSIQKRSTIDSSIAKYLKRDLYWRLKQALKARLDHVLLDFSLMEIFNDDLENSDKYLARNDFLDRFINQFVDQFLGDIQDILIAKGFEKLAVPDFETDFSHKFGFITFWGNFHARNGTVSDLTKIKRTGEFSLMSLPKSNKVQIFGSLGIDEFLHLQYNYYNAKIWNIGPWGELKARIGDNSVDFKLIAKISKSDTSATGLGMTFTDYEIKIDRFDDIKIECTGLSVVLNWLLSYIVTWITGYLKLDIIAVVEDKLRNLMDEILPTLQF